MGDGLGSHQSLARRVAAVRFQTGEKFQHEFGKPPALWTTVSLVERSFAVAQCTARDADEKYEGRYLWLFLARTKDGTWRTVSLSGAKPGILLAELLVVFKDKDRPGAPEKNQP